MSDPVSSGFSRPLQIKDDYYREFLEGLPEGDDPEDTTYPTSKQNGEIYAVKLTSLNQAL